MHRIKTRLALPTAAALFASAQIAMGAPIRFSIRATDAAPPLAGTIFLDLIDGDGMAGSSARVTDLSLPPTAMDGPVSPLLPDGFLLTDEALISTLAFATANVYEGLAFTLDAEWIGDGAIGFPDALVLGFTDADGIPLFATADPRGENVFLILSAAGGENYVPAPFSLSVREPGSEAVPEPRSMALFALGLGLMGALAVRRKRGLAVLALLAVSAGAAAAALNDVTGQITLDKAPLVYNRATRTFHGLVTVRNTSASVLGAPMYLVVSGLPAGVSVNNAIDLTVDGKPMLKLPVPQNGLLPGGAIPDFLVRFHNPDKLKFSAVFRVLSFSGALPPDPGEGGKSTLAGIDANGNGIRDDVEIYIAANFGHSEKLREALNQMAVSTQKGIVATTVQQSMDAANADMRSMECLRYVSPGSKAWKSLEAVSLNTPDRIRAWEAHEERLGGKVFPSAENEKASCGFDPDLLNN
ncbi:MAG TPA: PEP-CTERM sorting domain-containing protein [Fibrobacteria bacterium]|nr:PEP-CTERM sorting domain-containing protein [Fibrobacteria bacterium]